MPLRLCICALIPRIECRATLVLLIHHREVRKPTNTGALAARCLAGSEIHVSGAIGAKLDPARIAPPDAANLCLFPSEGAEPLTREFCRDLPAPIRLIVPDGNWGQASRMRKRLGKAADIRDVTLPPGPLTEYRLRREATSRPDGLATLEAIARALEIIDGPHVSGPLTAIFRTFVERTLWSRGKLKEDAVLGGIPPLTR
jgi:DTW domain-containing protein YfiP